MPFAAGSFLHQRYRIEALLGKGGMGAVYQAFDETLQIRVAVKENLNFNPEAERQFHREASLLAGLRHPNLPRVTDHFSEEDRQYLVMDFIEGVDLHARAKRHPPSVDEVLRWADALCDALGYLHTRTPPIIHRDVKPANVKLQPDGTIVLVDFGLAKVFDQHQTTTGARGLTPGFSPPEQYGGSRTDARTDQYSLAATIYALLTGRPPADSIERMLKKEELIRAAQFNPAVPAYVDSALTGALALEQDERFPDLAAFQQALGGRAPAPTVRAASAPARGRPRSRRGLWIAAGLGGLLLLGAIGMGGLVLLGRAAGAIPTASATRQATATTAATLPVVAPPPSETVQPSETPEPTLPATEAASPTAPVGIGAARAIALVSDREDGRTLQIWSMLPDGSQPRQMTFGPGDKTQPRWSPDGARLLFVAPAGKDALGNDLGLDIWAMNADGSGIQDVTLSPGDDTDPAWSSDGQSIAFTSDRIDRKEQVFQMESGCLQTPEGCQSVRQRNVSAGFAVEYSPAWSPDASQLAVVASINGAPGRIFIHDLVLPAAGTPVPMPAQFDPRDNIVGADHLRWSGDGAFFVFTWLQPTTNEIYLVTLDNPASPRKLTNTAGNKEPALSPDGSYIAFTSTRDQNPEVYVMSTSGADEINLTNLPTARDMQPDWQP
ncbi:MAG: serine/threonine-protein kinase [Anaerolineales bacterium]|nr:serine/threonine-protein kinase [Anaerolineales bacterium]